MDGRLDCDRALEEALQSREAVSCTDSRVL